MIEEVDMDVASGAIYISNYLSAQGCESRSRMVRTAAEEGNDDSPASCMGDRQDRVVHER